MILHSGIILYHGSYVTVEKPELEKCYPYKDFGRGFYLTTSQEQAVSFVRSSVAKAAGRGDVQPVLQKQRHAQHAALRNAALAMDLIEAEGQDRRAQDSRQIRAKACEALLKGKHDNNSFLFQLIVYQILWRKAPGEIRRYARQKAAAARQRPDWVAVRGTRRPSLPVRAIARSSQIERRIDE